MPRARRAGRRERAAAARSRACWPTRAAEVAEGRAARDGARAAARAQQQRARRRPAPSTAHAAAGRRRRRLASAARRGGAAARARRRRRVGGAAGGGGARVRGAARAANARVARRRAVRRQRLRAALVNGRLRRALALAPAASRAAVSTPEAAQRARQLHAAGKGIWCGTDEDVFIELIGFADAAAARALRYEYAMRFGHTLASAVRDEMGGRLEDLLLAFLDPPEPPPPPPTASGAAERARELHAAVEGLGTDGAAFVRVLGPCTAPALAKILEAYESRYGKRLWSVFAPSLCSTPTCASSSSRDASGRAPPRMIAVPRARPRADPASAASPLPRRLRCRAPPSRRRRRRHADRSRRRVRRGPTPPTRRRTSVLAAQSCGGRGYSPRCRNSLRSLQRRRGTAARPRSTRPPRSSVPSPSSPPARSAPSVPPPSTAPRTRSASPAGWLSWCSSGRRSRCNRSCSAASAAHRRRADALRGRRRTPPKLADCSRDRIVELLKESPRAQLVATLRAFRRQQNGGLASAANTRKRMREDAERATLESLCDAAEASGEAADTAFRSDPLAAQRARQLHAAGKGIWCGTDEDVFIELIGFADADAARALRYEYAMRFGHTLASAVRDEMGGRLEDLLLAFLDPPEPPRPPPSAAGAAERARELHAAVEGLGTDGAAFVRVLGGCSAPALAKILEAYESRYGKPLVERLRTEFVFDPDLRKLVVTRCAWARAATAARGRCARGGGRRRRAAGRRFRESRRADDGQCSSSACGSATRWALESRRRPSSRRASRRSCATHGARCTAAPSASTSTLTCRCRTQPPPAADDDGGGWRAASPTSPTRPQSVSSPQAAAAAATKALAAAAAALVGPSSPPAVRAPQETLVRPARGGGAKRPARRARRRGAVAAAFASRRRPPSHRRRPARARRRRAAARRAPRPPPPPSPRGLRSRRAARGSSGAGRSTRASRSSWRRAWRRSSARVSRAPTSSTRSPTRRRSARARRGAPAHGARGAAPVRVQLERAMHRVVGGVDRPPHGGSPSRAAARARSARCSRGCRRRSPTSAPRSPRCAPSSPSCATPASAASGRATASACRPRAAPR